MKFDQRFDPNRRTIDFSHYSEVAYKGASFDRIRTRASGKALKGHIFKSKRVQDPHECLMFCYSEFTCQSYIYVIIGKLCELNNRTEEATMEEQRYGSKKTK